MCSVVESGHPANRRKAQSMSVTSKITIEIHAAAAPLGERPNHLPRTRNPAARARPPSPTAPATHRPGSPDRRQPTVPAPDEPRRSSFHKLDKAGRTTPKTCMAEALTVRGCRVPTGLVRASPRLPAVPAVRCPPPPAEAGRAGKTSFVQFVRICQGNLMKRGRRIAGTAGRRKADFRNPRHQNAIH